MSLTHSGVVEFGQFSTDIFKLYSAANPETDYYAVNHSLERKQIVSKINKDGLKLISGNAECLNLEELGIAKKSVDCILLLNVLESMIDPWKFLTSLIDFLSENGMIVAVFQNWGHWSTIYNLIQGVWEYGNDQLPSNEHIRFYNFSTISDLFDGVGYHVLNFDRLYNQDIKYQAFASILSNPFKQLNFDMEKFEEQALTQKYVIRAKVKEATGTMKVSNLYFQEICKAMKGDVLNIGSSDDQDKMGGCYENYFKNKASYTKLDFNQSLQADIVGNIENLKGVVSDESYDVVFCIWVLEHVKDILSAISELHRILRPNGYFIFGVPLNLKFHSFPDDYHRYTLSGFQELLKDKFKMIEIKSSGPEEPYQHDSRLNLFGSIPDMAPSGYMGMCQKI
ncbi:MAG: methyltransferase domain-containing protein [Desulfobacter sp.]|nr:MAG: methyltransferase domain-containing protein [Desulfobacter sp.]